VVYFNGNGTPPNGPHFTPTVLRGRVGGGGGVSSLEGYGRVKRESLGRAGGLQTPARPRRSADGRPHAPPIPARVALLILFAGAMNGGLR
jgi:hypothetical protein